MVVIGPEVQSVAGTAQLGARQRSGCEAAGHAMKKLYSGDSEGVLLVDATNAFNSLNRRVMLHNIQRLCPAFCYLCDQLLSEQCPTVCGWRDSSFG